MTLTLKLPHPPTHNDPKTDREHLQITDKNPFKSDLNLDRVLKLWCGNGKEDFQQKIYAPWPLINKASYKSHAIILPNLITLGQELLSYGAEMDNKKIWTKELWDLDLWPPETKINRNHLQVCNNASKFELNWCRGCLVMVRKCITSWGWYIDQLTKAKQYYNPFP